jgi:hypothetical protein
LHSIAGCTAMGFFLRDIGGRPSYFHDLDLGGNPTPERPLRGEWGAPQIAGQGGQGSPEDKS